MIIFHREILAATSLFIQRVKAGEKSQKERKNGAVRPALGRRRSRASARSWPETPQESVQQADRYILFLIAFKLYRLQHVQLRLKAHYWVLI